MTNRILYTIFIAIAISLIPFSAVAQRMPGSWSLLPSAGTSFVEVIETPDRTYMLSGENLMAITNDGETVYYNSSNRLSDSSIDIIRYNWQKNYLFIAYSNGNIDLLYDNGRCVNMPELKDATLTTSHAVRDVAFGSDRILAATDFGFVLFDDVRHQVVESGIYNQKVDKVMILGQNMLLLTNTEMLWSPLSQRHPRLDSFEPIKDGSGNLRLWPLNMSLAAAGQSAFFNVAANKGLYLYDFDGTDGTVTKKVIATGIDCQQLQFGEDKVGFAEQGRILFSDTEGNIDEVILPEDIAGDAVFSTIGKESVWVATPQGITHYDLSGNTPSLIGEAFSPKAVKVAAPSRLRWNGNTLVVGAIGRSRIYPLPVTKLQVSLINNDGSISDYNVAPLSDFGDGGIIFFDPEIEGRAYGASASKGLHIIDNGDIIATYTTKNTPMGDFGGTQINDLNLDAEGNLWVANGHINTSDPMCVILPASVRKRTAVGQIGYDEWKVATMPSSFEYNHDGKMLIATHSPLVLFGSSAWNSGLAVLNHNKTYTDTSDDSSIHHSKLTDQSGASAQNCQVNAMAEDHNGRIWLGTESGVMVLDPSQAMTPGCIFQRPLVARNDGTNYGDYLLATDKIYDIAVDHSNRKWLATGASGLYLVSADGSEILEHFNTDNSPLPSNFVYSVSVDPQSACVYVGTEAGIFIYNGTSSPAAEDYGQVKVTPNPVRPDYSGWITISGLMENSLVKIADTAGNVICTGRSEGGNFSWDGCDSTGRRVRTGVYYVLASQNQQGNSGIVAKYMVVN